jgi:tetratricopeptide (TPR) repeat protein
VRTERVAPAVRGPEVDRGVTGEELDKDVRRELTTLRTEAAESAAKHLVMVARLLHDDPEAAYAHAEAARKHGPRVGVIREALGVAAYAAGRYAEALAELRAARRISGNQDHWPMMADCERALGRPEKALQMAAAPEVAQLSRAGKVEMRIVAAGARADLGQLDAAVVTLQSPELNDRKPSDWLPRLRFAYAAALEAVGRHDEARTWFERAAEADPDGLTDAAERVAELDGVVFLDAEDAEDAEDADVDTGADTGADTGDVGAGVESPTAASDAGKPVAGKPEAEPPVAEPPVAEQAVAEQAVAEQAVAEQAVAEEAVAEQAVAEQPAVEPARGEVQGVLFLDPGDLG